MDQGLIIMQASWIGSGIFAAVTGATTVQLRRRIRQAVRNIGGDLNIAAVGEPSERGHGFDGEVNKFNPVYQFLDKLYKLDSGGGSVASRGRILWEFNKFNPVYLKTDKLG